MGLYEKIFKVMEESEGIEKDMTVGFSSNSYKAVSEASVLNAIKPLLKKHRLVLFPVEQEVVDRYDTFTTQKGESSRLMTQIKSKYKIVDVDTGESEILETVGNGVDTQDKASGKALTYGYKALLQKTFMLFSGEDTDNKHSDEITDNNTKPNVLSEKQVTRLYAIALKKGFNAKDIKAHIFKKYGKAELFELTRKEYDEAVSGYEKLEDKK